jgi:hypothetical protein
MDIGHTYDMKVQTQWTYIWHKSSNTMDIQIRMYVWIMMHKHRQNTDSKRNKPIQEDSSKHRFTIHSSDTSFQSFLNFDKHIQTQTQKNWPTLQTNSDTNSKKDKPTLQINSNIDSKIQNKLTH